MSERTKSHYLITYIKGMAMGAADVVPGVSGGTIAFITGIYQELLDTIKGLRPQVLLQWRNDGFKATWTRINGNFLVALFLGIITSVVSLAKGITFMLHTYPVLVWAFFFGLIIASTILISRQIRTWNVLNAIMLAATAAMAFFITVAAPAQMPEGPGYIFLAGCIAICAMILPGISGSFILLLLGAYATVLGSISGLVDGLRAADMEAILPNGINIAVFITGCIVGIIAFSNFLSWLFKRAYDATMAGLTGFMIGSLNKVWPWKEVTEYRVNSHGEEVPFLEKSVMPEVFEQVTGEPAQLGMAMGCALAGFLLVTVMERIAARS